MAEHIVVIGAGIAGLAAASALQAAGLRAIVLEARPRLGGRIWTDRSLGAPLDLGASRIHGRAGNPLTELAQAAGAPLLESDPSAAYLVDEDGRPLDKADLAEVEAVYERLLADVIAFGRRAGPLSTWQTALRAVLPRYDALPATTQRGLRFLLAGRVGMWFAADFGELSLANAAYDEAFPGPEAVLPGGYGDIAAYLATGVDIRLGYQVRQVAVREGRVTLATNRGDFRADRAVVTVPLGVLQREAIGFDPPLPDEKLEAIGWLGMGTLNKIALRFREPFWPVAAHALGYLNGRTDETLEFWNATYTGASILVAYAGGSFARTIENMPEGEAVAVAMSHLRAMFGSAAPDPIAVARTRWASDAYAGGSYSYLSPGSGPEHRTSLARPVGRQLFFAGEATSAAYSGTVHGALLSGREAARQILRPAGWARER